MQDDDGTPYEESSSEDDDEKLEIPVNRRRIFAEKSDPPISALYEKYKDGRLDTQADFQREFVWDITRSSRLIESAMLGIPLPIIYLSQEFDDKKGIVECVIDGQQRLRAFFSFIDGKFPNDSEFRLSKLKVLDQHNGKRFDELPRVDQSKIKDYSLRTITFDGDSDEDLKYEIFERLNTGAVSLKIQELRNCMYRGTYNDLLKDLAKDEGFKSLLGMKPDNRMRDVSLVLRFAAFYHETYIKYKPPMKSFLNREMVKNRSISDEEADELRSAFKKTVRVITSLLGENAFKRFYRGNERESNGYWEPKQFNVSLYDILMDSFARRDERKVRQNLDAIREALVYLMTSDDEFINSIKLSTSSKQAVDKRFKIWTAKLDDIIGVQRREERCFSRELKQEFYNANPTCKICGQWINHIDDAALDHIKQYWQGGETIPENARLTHRFCNWSRPRKE